MPPRVRADRLVQPTSSQCFRTRPSPGKLDQQICQAKRQASSTSERSSGARIVRRTRLRRDMASWLEGPGSVFRFPLQGSTNYMGAYDQFGNLRRTRKGNDGGKLDEDKSEDSSEEEIVQKEIEQGLSNEERERRADKRRQQEEEKTDEGANGKRPREGVSDLRPYPLNQKFHAQAVLSEELREELYRQVAGKGLDISTVSSVYGVDMRRVAAAVRLKTIEKQWQAEGKKLATPYSRAILDMLPQTPFTASKAPVPHESINDLPVHPKTRQQIFYPTSESRAFTREDAAKVFDRNLLPADKRIAHPELIEIEKWNLQNLGRAERIQRLKDMDEKSTREKAEKAEKEAAWKERSQRVVPGRRWDFKFQDITVSKETVGGDGRGRSGVGYRYGVPHQDRKRGLIKIPTSVE